MLELYSCVVTVFPPAIVCSGNQRYKTMKLIVAQKQMNLSLLLAVTCIAIGLASCLNKPAALVSAATPGNSGLIFADSWCRKKDLLTPEAKHTVELLLEKVGTTNCDAAARKLSSLTSLYLDGSKVTDIKPLASLTNLTQRSV